MCQIEACFESGRNLLFKVSLLSTAQTLEPSSARGQQSGNGTRILVRRLKYCLLNCTTQPAFNLESNQNLDIFSSFVVHQFLAEDDDDESSMFQSANLRARHHERVSRNEPSHQVKSTRSSVSQSDPC